MASTTLPINSTNVRHRIRFAWYRLHLPVAAVVAPGAALETAARLFTTPPRFAHTPRELALLATGERFAVASPLGPLAAWRFGAKDRPVVLLSHGWGGRGAQLRAFVPALLAAGYQAVLFDHLGHGHSEGRESTLVHFIAGLDAVARAVEAGGATLAGAIGHSLGAAAVGAWLKETGRALRVVLVAPPTSLTRHSGHFARSLGLPERVRRAMQERFERRLGRSWQEFELPHSVRGIRAGALVIHDRDDREVPMASGLALARAWPGARFVATTGLGHRAVIRDPGVVADAIDYLTDAVVFPPPPPRGARSGFAAPAPIL